MDDLQSGILAFPMFGIVRKEAEWLRIGADLVKIRVEKGESATKKGKRDDSTQESGEEGGLFKGTAQHSHHGNQ